LAGTLSIGKVDGVPVTHKKKKHLANKPTKAYAASKALLNKAGSLPGSVINISKGRRKNGIGEMEARI